MFFAMAYIRIRIEIRYVDPDLHNWDRDLPDPDLEADVDPVSWTTGSLQPMRIHITDWNEKLEPGTKK